METTVKKKMYEGMFLVDSANAAGDWEGINAAIRKILDRVEAEIISIRKWDDRRLAYEIQHVGRGTYLLAYFKAEGRMIQEIETAARLSDTILRVLILSAEHMTSEDMEKDTPAMKAEQEASESAQDTEETSSEESKETTDDATDTPEEAGSETAKQETASDSDQTDAPVESVDESPVVEAQEPTPTGTEPEPDQDVEKKED